MSSEVLLSAIHAIRAEPSAPRRQAMAWQVVLDQPRISGWLAKRVLSRYMGHEDAVAEAQIALYKALLYVDPAKGSVFKVARWYCYRAIQPRLGIHVPQGAIDATLRFFRDHHHDSMGPMGPIPFEAARGLIEPSGEDRARLAWLLASPISESPGVVETHHVPIEDLDHFACVLDEEELDIHQLRVILDDLPPRERESALAGCGEDTLGSVARRHGVSREWIRQIQVRTRRKIAGHLLHAAPMIPTRYLSDDSDDGDIDQLADQKNDQARGDDPRLVSAIHSNAK